MGKTENDSLKMKIIQRRHTYFQGSIVRWTLTITWTALTAALMLMPGNEGSTVAETSALFGGTETTDAIGHVIINAILALIWYWTISLYVSPTKTTRLILIGGIVWCFGAELSQFFVPERGTSLLDLGANILGVVIGLKAYRWLGVWKSP